MKRTQLQTRRSSSRRRGNVMVMFAILLFAIVPLMALILHTGTLTLTRRQMQTAVNAAALEGLRFRDAATTEMDRRNQVREIVQNVFDDNIDPDDGKGNFRLGAGPEIDFDPNSGIELSSDTDFRASRLITGIGVWKPAPELNTGDQPHGDMVAGNYVFDPSDPDHDSHEEFSDYTREDFGSQAGGDAFLVRLRRTDDAGGLDELAGISSRGPTIPYLFGRGAYGPGNPPPTPNDLRERGTIVRATAIANARAVKTAGWYDTPDIEHGLAPVWIDVTTWGDATAPIPISADDFVEPGNSPVSVGMSLQPGTASDLNGDRYVALYQEIDGAGQRIVGFGRGTIAFDSNTGSGTATRLPQSIAPLNASAAILGLADDLNPQKWEDVFQEHQRFEPSSPAFQSQLEPLLAPALERTVY